VPTLSLRDITIEYGDGEYAVRPIDGLSLDVHDGQLVLLLGASGCGKTTLLSAIASLLRPTSGTITLDGVDVTGLGTAELNEYRRHSVGMVFQAFNLIPSLTALENVMVPLRAAGRSRHASRERARALLDDLGLTHRIDHKPGDLSGGQQQRVAIARALALEPPVLLADEPTAHLDFIAVEDVLRLVRRLAAPGRIVVISTHDERLVPLADRVVELTSRTIARSGPPEHLTLADGDVVFRQGEPGDRIYVIERGAVDIVRELTDGGDELLNQLHPPNYFGELSAMLGTPRSATARARGDTVLRSYSLTDFRALGRGLPGPDA
jgi:putative ABC transport system ATP-binding protein